MKDVARLTGFAYPSHFTDRFKRLPLTIPAPWLRGHRGHRGRPPRPPPEEMPEAA